jgi:hypothetical protein
MTRLDLAVKILADRLTLAKFNLLMPYNRYKALSKELPAPFFSQSATTTGIQ